MSEVIMKINGKDMSDYFRLTSLKGRTLPGRSVELLDIAGRNGGLLDYFKLNAREIEAEILVSEEDTEDVIQIFSAISYEFNSEKLHTFEFSDEEGLEYYGIVSDISEGEIVNGTQKISITILCPDPLKYGPEIEADFPSDTVTITNNGNSPTKPIFELEATKPTTFLAISTGEETMMVGRPIGEGEIPVRPYERVANLTLGTLVGWSQLTDGQVLSGGIVGGQMRTTGASFEAQSYGTNPNGWVGPAVKRSFGEPLQNFAIDITVTSRNTQGVTGKLMAILLDSSDNEIATMTLIDGTVGMPRNSAVFTIGNKTILNEAGELDRAYNNETVHLNLSRKGRSIVAYAYKQTGNIRTGRVRRTYRDDQMEHQAPVASVILYIAKYKDYAPYPMSFNRLIADKNYMESELEIPYIAQPGDIILLDHQTNGIYINGEPSKALKQFGSQYFSLNPGTTPISILPEDTFVTKARFREAYF